MRVVRLTDVDQGQHHENERLQGDDHDVEDGPNRTGNDVPNGQQHARQRRSGITAHQGNQHEDEFARIHIAEKSHAVRYGFGSEFDHLHEEIHGPQERMGAKWCAEQLMHPSANAFDFDVVEHAHQQHGSGHTQSGGQVGRRNDAHVSVVRVTAHGTKNRFPNHGEQIDREQVHGIEQENPDENGQRQWSNQFTAVRVVHDAFGLVVDHFD